MRIFEVVFNNAMPTQIVFQQPAKLASCDQTLLSSHWFGATFNHPHDIGSAMTPLNTLIVLGLVLFSALTNAADGLVSIKSPLGPKETMDRLENIVKQRGLNVFARIDHAAGAAKVGKSLRPTELLIFGNPQGGTPFMECAQSVGIDLPLKALVWQDQDNQVWLSYNNPEFLAKRHAVTDCKVVSNLSKALADIAEATTAN